MKIITFIKSKYYVSIRKSVPVYVLILFLIMLSSNKGYSQNYAFVDSITDAYPKDISSYEVISNLIKNDFSQPDQKARAIFRWVATSISFDVKLADSMGYKSIKVFAYSTEKEKIEKEKKFKANLLSKLLVSKKTVSHGYAILVEHLCQKVDIEVHIITGNLKTDPSQIGNANMDTNHAWNVVNINGKWKFLDTTLASGYVYSNSNVFKFYYNDAYFFTHPDLLFLNHYPLNEKWLLTNKTKEEYISLPVFIGNYFENTYRITQPVSGIWSIKKQGNFVFTLDGIDQYDDVGYVFLSDGKVKYFEERNNANTLTIELNEAREDYLSVMINSRTVAIYKIVL